MKPLLNYLINNIVVSQSLNTQSGFFADSKTKEENIFAVFNCLEKSIIDFVKEANEQNLLDEPNLTQLLVQNLMDGVNEEDLPFYFLRENLERKGGNSPSNDFAAYMFRPKRRNQPRQNEEKSSRILILRFEAKRLDEKLPRSREKEYVIGNYSNSQKIENTGGIERFKNQTHGGEDSFAAIIGFIQSGNSPIWLAKVNSWIDEQIVQSSDPKLLWQQEDKLLEAPPSGILYLEEFTSRSKKQSGSTIELFHFWIWLKS